MKKNMTGFRPAGFEADTPQGVGPENVDGIETAGILRVQKTYIKDGKTTDEEQGEDVLVVRRFLTEPAKVGTSFKRTINTAPYESITIEASVYLPCYAEEAVEVVQHASAIVGKFVTSEEFNIRKMLGLKQVFNVADSDE